MSLEEMFDELKALIAEVEAAPEDKDTSEEQKRMAELTERIESLASQGEKAAQERGGALEAAKRAIEGGAAKRVDRAPLARSAQGLELREGGSVRDVTDYAGAAKRAWLKRLATSAGVTLAEGNELTDAERRASFNITTGTASEVVPVELKNQIVSLVDASATLFGDVTRDSMRGQYEIVRHKAIAKGDAAQSAEGAAPADDEENSFERITLSGVEIKKTAKMSRKMAVQAMDGFEAWLVREIGGRLTVAANAFVISRMDDATLGIAANNKLSAAKAGTLAKADLMRALAKLRTFGNAAPKGAVVYASNDTIWNSIATIEDATGRAYFVNEKSEDPAVQGRIFGKQVKLEDMLPAGTVLVGYPDLFVGNVFDGPSVEAYRATDGSQRTCFDGYMLYDGGLTVPEAFVKLAVGTPAATK